MELLDALDKLSERYFAEDWYSKGISGIGIGQGVLEVYVIEDYDNAILPLIFEGWPVVPIPSLDIAPLMLPKEAANDFVNKLRHKLWFQKNVVFVSYDKSEIVVYLKSVIPPELPKVYDGRAVRSLLPK